MSRLLSVLMVGALAGCSTPILDPVPPEQDPASSEAPAAPWTASKNPLTTSAFEGVKLDGGGHHHHHHGGEDKKKPAEATPAEKEEGDDK